MKKFIIPMFVAVSLVSPAFASAAPVAVSSSTTAAPACVVITRTIYPGAHSDDVSKMQSVLNAKGYLNSTPTGFFGAMTSAAVKKFQADNKLEATGSVGPRTRALIQSASCGTASAVSAATISAPIKVAAPIVGVAPIKVIVDQTTSNTASNGDLPNSGGDIKHLPGSAPTIPVTDIVATFAPLTINGGVRSGLVMFSFKLTNNTKEAITLSKIPSLSLSTSTVGSAGTPAIASSTVKSVVTGPFTVDGDTGIAPTSGAYMLPAGATRQFTYYGQLDNTNGIAGIRVLRITAINYTETESGNPQSITTGIDGLVVNPWLDGGAVSEPVTVVKSIGLQVQNPSATFEPTANPNSTSNTIGLASSGVVTFKFTAVSTGNQPIYISKDANIAATAVTSGTTFNSMVVAPDSLSGDRSTGSVAGAYVVPAGTSRDFTITMNVDNTRGVAGTQVFGISQISFGSAANGSLKLSSVATPDLSVKVTLAGQSNGGNNSGTTVQDPHATDSQ